MLTLQIRGGSSPLKARVSVIFRSATAPIRRKTDTAGTVTFDAIDIGDIHHIYVDPLDAGFEITVVKPLDAAFRTRSIDCARLPAGPTAWWHELANWRRQGHQLGRGIVVGVVDAPFTAAAFADFRAVAVPGAAPFDHRLWRDDPTSHGAQVCSFIAAPCDDQGFGGIAPAAAIRFAAAVNERGKASQVIVSNAIDLLTRDHGADIVNISLGDCPDPTPSLQKIVRLAEDRGALCFFGAGNCSGKVLYPARYEECIAVGTLGCTKWGGPYSAAKIDCDLARRYGDESTFVAEFSPRGPGLDLLAPGVGIVVNVNGAGHYQMTGSSFSSPVAAAILAAALSADSHFFRLPRTRERSGYMRTVLKSLCRDLGFDELDGGWGVPRLLLA
jgi:hypothetical protein